MLCMTPRYHVCVVCTVAESRYAEEEEQQYNKLCILIKDAVYLRVFIKVRLPGGAAMGRVVHLLSRSACLGDDSSGQEPYPRLHPQPALLQTALSQVAQALSSSSDSMLIFLPDQQVRCSRGQAAGLHLGLLGGRRWSWAGSVLYWHTPPLAC